MAVLAVGAALLPAMLGGSIAYAGPTFETGTNPPTTLRQLNPGNTDLTGWKVIAVTGLANTSVDWIRNTIWQAHEGNFSVDLNGSDAGKISKTYTGLTIGKVYLVTFWMSGNPDNGTTGVRKLKLTIANQSGTFSFPMAGVTRAAMKYQKFGLLFTATGTTQVLSFQSLSPGGPFGPVVDDIDLVAFSPPVAAK
ncbi:MAG: choice-of-anchor C family protein [Geminicoccaceae bacterium]